VEPLPEPADPGLKDRVVAVSFDGVDRVYALPRIADAAGSSRGTWTDSSTGVELRFTFDLDRGTALVETVDPEHRLESVRYAFWFAWFANHPGGPSPFPHSG